METIPSPVSVIVAVRHVAVMLASGVALMTWPLSAWRCVPRWRAIAIVLATLLLCGDSLTYCQQGQPSSSSPSSEAGLRQDVEKHTQRLKTSPSDVATLLARGKALEALSLVTNDESDLKAAAADLQKATQLSPDDPQAWAAFAGICEQEWLHDEAIAAYTRVIELDANNADAVLGRGLLYNDIGKYHEAIGDFNRAIQLSKTCVEAYFHRGWSHGALKEFDQAIRDFDSALRLDPKSPVPLAARGVVRIWQNRIQQGAGDIWQAIQLNPGDAGVDFEAANGKSLSPEAIEHGKKQVAAMLRDRPVMAKHVAEGDPIHTWAMRKFAGEDSGGLIDWDSADPFPFPSECSPQDPTQRASIRISPLRNDGNAYSFEQCWSMAVFELNNVVSLAGNKKLIDDVLNDRICRTDYIMAVFREEERSVQLTRAFYLKVFLPFSQSRDIADTSPATWHCDEFVSPGDHDTQVRLWRRDKRWGYNDVYYDLISAERDFRAGRHEDMQRRLQKVLGRAKALTVHQLTQVHYWLGNLFAAQGDLKSALVELSLALCLSPSMDAASLVRGRVLVEGGSHQEAIAEMTRLIDRGAYLADAHCYRGIALSSLNKRDHAMGDFNEAIRMAPNRADFLRVRAYEHHSSNDLDNALTDYTQALLIDPSQSRVFSARASVWMAKQEYDKAISDCSEAVRLDPKNGEAFFLRGRAYESSGKSEQAEKDFAMADQLGHELNPASGTIESPE